MTPGLFFSELRRRNVYKVALGYSAVGWLVAQAAITLFPLLGVAEELAILLEVVVVLVFPLALLVAWFFEMTPQGMKRTELIAPDEKLPQWSRKKFMALVVGSMLLAAALLAVHLLLVRT